MSPPPAARGPEGPAAGSRGGRPRRRFGARRAGGSPRTSRLRAGSLAAVLLVAFPRTGPACTGFVAVQGDSVFAGNNEDWYNPATRMWFVPAADGAYGRVYFGFDDDWPQGGMNERGLFFDGFAVGPREVVRTRGRPAFRGNLADRAMAECATVGEVAALFGRYDLGFLKRGMLMFGDARGNAAVFEGDAAVFKTGAHQVCTNFRRSRTPPERITCRRYLKAEALLSRDGPLTADRCRSILDSVHVDFTQYSNVYDLVRRTVRLYHFHDFEHGVTVRLDDELRKGAHAVDLPSLFPEKAAFRRMVSGKRTPLNSAALRALLVLGGFVFALAPFLFRAGRNRLREESGRRFRAAGRLLAPAQALLTAACVPAWIYLIALWRHPQVFTLGPPASLDGFPAWVPLVLHVPALEAVLVPVLLLTAGAAFAKRIWNGLLRFTLLSTGLLLAVHVALFHYWGLLGLFR